MHDDETPQILRTDVAELFCLGADRFLPRPTGEDHSTDRVAVFIFGGPHDARQDESNIGRRPGESADLRGLWPSLREVSWPV